MCTTADSKALHHSLTNTRSEWQKYRMLTITDSTSGKTLGSSNTNNITAVHYRSLGKLQKELWRDSPITLRKYFNYIVYH